MSHGIPAKVYKDWPTAIENAKAGERVSSESDSDQEGKSRKTIQRKVKGKKKVRTESPESEEAEFSNVDSGSESEGRVAVKDEPVSDSDMPTRYLRSRATSIEDTADVEVEPHVELLDDDHGSSVSSELFLPDDSEVDLGLSNGEDEHREGSLEPVAEDQWQNLDDEECRSFFFCLILHADDT